MNVAPDQLSKTAPPTSLGLGIDAGGTQTRWALARAGEVLAQGQVAGLSGLQMADEGGRAELARTLAALAAALQPYGPIGAIHAGITGLPDSDLQGIAEMKCLLAQSLAMTPQAIHCRSDIRLAWHAAFSAKAGGYLIYAGTGSVAAFVDSDDRLHRAGGRGLLLGDEGSGGWIAAQALAQVWRMEDAAPGSAMAESAMARALFAAMGSSDWTSTRAYVYKGSRGQLGQLAMAVAASAQEDPRAAALLRRAGQELARLAEAMVHRFGPRPIVLAGRALTLSPLIEHSLRQHLNKALGAAADIQLQQLQPQRQAALAAALAAI
ncbi:N-acetylglucosamine kinase [Roseateles albus]|uniref:BadF/BadG/BcrA/BcrD ATPase family protein n=1 Tax=Roseateles albus TaxID=2987525 RepID=A0ABT5KDN9_9BURK|nr:BadF/BadG/BcrA/BcrD ATPase family protein [Roseateles albus]MDC8772044.1 BadF/BadG/BcrA/BcrD ATPase family protein [Roseateles albus]